MWISTRQLQRIFYGLGSLALLVYLGGFALDLGRQLGAVILIFLFAGMLNLALLRVVRGLRQITIRSHRIPYAAAVLLVALLAFSVIAAVLTLLVPLIVSDLRGIIGRLGEYSDEFDRLADWTIGSLGSLGLSVTSVDQVIAEYSSTLQGVAGQAAAEILAGLTSVASGVVNMVLVLIVTVYLMLNWDPGREKLQELLPPRIAGYLAIAGRTISGAFGAYMLGVAVEVVLFGISVAAVLAIAGVDYIVFAAVVSGLVLVIPIVGAVVALALPVLIALLDSVTVAIFWVGIPLLVIQLVLENFVRPSLVGRVAGVNPLVLITSVLVGAALFGIWGIIFGIPAGVLISLTVKIIFSRWVALDLAHLDQPPTEAGGQVDQSGGP